MAASSISPVIGQQQTVVQKAATLRASQHQTKCKQQSAIAPVSPAVWRKCLESENLLQTEIQNLHQQGSFCNLKCKTSFGTASCSSLRALLLANQAESTKLAEQQLATAIVLHFGLASLCQVPDLLHQHYLVAQFKHHSQ
jgi:hypothetical protein